MPVAGLPAAAEASLSSLLETQALSSWKIVGGTGTSTVVVLRFNQRDTPPFPTSHYTQRTWRTKPPSAQRRDQRRAESHRANREQTINQTVALGNAATENTAKSTFKPDNATSTHHTAVATLTSDLPSQASFPIRETADDSSPAPDHDNSENENPPSMPPEQDDITLEYCQEALNRMVERITEKTTEVRQDIAEVREKLSGVVKSQSTPHENTQASHRPSRKPLTQSDLRTTDHHSRHRQAPSDEAEGTDPVRPRPTTRHRAREDDDEPPPRVQSVGRMKKK